MLPGGYSLCYILRAGSIIALSWVLHDRVSVYTWRIQTLLNQKLKETLLLEIGDYAYNGWDNIGQKWDWIGIKLG